MPAYPLPDLIEDWTELDDPDKNDFETDNVDGFQWNWPTGSDPAEVALSNDFGGSGSHWEVDWVLLKRTRGDGEATWFYFDCDDEGGERLVLFCCCFFCLFWDRIVINLLASSHKFPVHV